ncbi:MAG: hypothetical protein BA863_18590 [Desulfovibrio sp. S3730MH75]|nr:MAG: hypothetical protein BA863_18590 [Desulfovibrio sp. S3730MH75]
MRQEFQKPAWMNDWKIFLVFSLVSFAIAFGLRCLDLPKWDNPAFYANGEVIQGTHDAYFWLAGAKGVGSAVGNPMSTILSFLGDVTGAQLGNIAFWLPAVFAGFCAVAAFSWGMLVVGPWAGLVAAVYATSIPAYYFRTRLSYYDTDVVTLFFPLLISVLLARWVSLGSRTSWLSQKEDKVKFNPMFWDYCLTILAGAITAYGKQWHGDVQTFGTAAALIAAALSMVCGTKSSRPVLLRGLVLFALTAFAGWAGFAAALLLLGLFTFYAVKNHRLYNNLYLYLAMLIAIFALSGMGAALISSISGKILSYLKPVSHVTKQTTGPLYPGIAQSVIEAQNISFKALFANLTGSETLGWLGFISFSFALVMTPSLLFLLPFAVVTFAAITMGGRFSMFGGIVLGLGLSFVVCWAIDILISIEKRKIFFKAAQAIAIVGILLYSTLPMYRGAPPTPIMSPAHVVALVEAGKGMPKDSTVWTWWDWGYATMYYAGVHSFANGGNHAGPVLFPLGFAHASPSFMQANQMIKFSAASGGNPAVEWNKMTAAEVENQLRSFSAAKYQFPKVPKQYMVVSWENVRLAYWILYYGSWNVQAATGTHPNVRPIYKSFDFDKQNGMLTIKGEAPLSVSSCDLLSLGARTVEPYPSSVGPHLIYNELARQGFLVDDFVYSSMLMRLLIDDPANSKLSKSFRLVYEGFPFVRVYEVI